LSESDTDADRFGQGGPRSTYSDTFGLEGNAPSKEQALAHRKYMDEYQSLLDPSWQRPAAANPANPLLSFADAARPTGTPAAGLGGLPSLATHKGLEAQMDVTHPMLGSPGLPDVNAQALGLPRRAPASPTVESPKMIAPTFEAPKRAF
jgi:hypothetical protein